MNATAPHGRERTDVTAFGRERHRRPETEFDVNATASIVADWLRVGVLQVETGPARRFAAHPVQREAPLSRDDEQHFRTRLLATRIRGPKG